MSVFGIAMVRDEEDVIEAVVRHMATQVDHLVVADNLSKDGTREILDRLALELPLTILDDQEPGYFQSAKTSALATIAHDAGAEWIVPFDADEIWYSPFGRIADVLAEVAPQWLVASAALYDHVATAADPNIPNPVERIKWRRNLPGDLPKVACRYREDLTIEQGNHAASYLGGATTIPGLLVVRHFPYRSAEQFVRKARNGAAAYKATDLGPNIGAHWRQYGAIAEAHGDEECAGIFRQWFWSADPSADRTLIHDPAPI